MSYADAVSKSLGHTSPSVTSLASLPRHSMYGVEPGMWVTSPRILVFCTA